MSGVYSIPKWFIAMVILVLAGAGGGYYWWESGKKTHTYEEFFVEEFKRIQRTAETDKTDLERDFENSVLTYSEDEHKPDAVRAYADRLNIEYARSRLPDIGEHQWTDNPAGSNGWRLLLKASKLVDDEFEKWDAGKFSYWGDNPTPIRSHKPGDFEEPAYSTDIGASYLNTWNLVEPILDEALAKDDISHPSFGSDEESVLHSIKMFALRCEYYSPLNGTDRFSRVRKAIAVGNKYKYPYVGFIGINNMFWDGYLLNSLVSVSQTVQFTQNERIEYAKFFTKCSTMKTQLQAMIWYIAHFKHNDHSLLFGRPGKKYYEEYWGQPDTIEDYANFIADERSDDIDEIIEALSWSEINEDIYENPALLTEFIGEFPRFSNGTNFYCCVRSVVVGKVARNMVIDPIKDGYEPTWLSNTALVDCKIVGNELVLSWNMDDSTFLPESDDAIMNGEEITKIRWR